MPGPLQAFLLAQTLRQGWKRTIPAAMAPLISDGPIILLVLLVLTRLPNSFLVGLRLVGGAFLLYLAWDAYQACRTAAEQTNEPSPSLVSASVWKAVLTNFLNPNPYIFWSILAGPILLSGWQESAWNGVGFILGMYGALVGGLALFVYLFGTATQQSWRLRQTLTLVSAVALLGFGLFQFWWVLSRL